uniref:Uncharacterized protein n=1 Tax=Glossina pallidipes TaxID=7398 RepID=A0A1A9ZBD0_GLOPL
MKPHVTARNHSSIVDKLFKRNSRCLNIVSSLNQEIVDYIEYRGLAQLQDHTRDRRRHLKQPWLCLKGLSTPLWDDSCFARSVWRSNANGIQKQVSEPTETLPSQVIIDRFNLPSVAGILTLKLSPIIMDSVSAVAIPGASAGFSFCIDSIFNGNPSRNVFSIMLFILFAVFFRSIDTSRRKASMCSAFPLSTLLERNFLFVSQLNVKPDITILLGSLLLWEESETHTFLPRLKQSIDRAVGNMRTELTVPINDLKSVVDGYNDSIKKVERELTKANPLSVYNFLTDREVPGSLQHKRIFFNDRYFSMAAKQVVLWPWPLILPPTVIENLDTGVTNSTYLKTFFQDDIDSFKVGHLNCCSSRPSINSVKLDKIEMILGDEALDILMKSGVPLVFRFLHCAEILNSLYLGSTNGVLSDSLCECSSLLELSKTILVVYNNHYNYYINVFSGFLHFSLSYIIGWEALTGNYLVQLTLGVVLYVEE